MSAWIPTKASLLSVKSTLGRVFVYSALLAAYSGLAVFKEHTRYADDADFPSSVYAILSVIVSMLLVFRTNSAYAKWWEARTLWGTLVNASRNLAVKCRHFVDAPADELNRLADFVSIFAHTLKDHLRHINDLKRVQGFEDLVDDPHHPPSLVASRIYGLIESWRRESRVSDQMVRVLDVEARLLLDVCGGCERILNTRLAFSYRLFVNTCVFLYLATLPWGLVQEFEGWTIPMVFVVSFLLIGLEVVAHAVESPFGHDDDDLDLDGLCAAIDRSVREIIREPAEEQE